MVPTKATSRRRVESLCEATASSDCDWARYAFKAPIGIDTTSRRAVHLPPSMCALEHMHPYILAHLHALRDRAGRQAPLTNRPTRYSSSCPSIQRPPPIRGVMNRHIGCIYGMSDDNCDGNFGRSTAVPSPNLKLLFLLCFNFTDFSAYSDTFGILSTVCHTF